MLNNLVGGEIANRLKQQVYEKVDSSESGTRDKKDSRMKVAVMFLDIRNFTPFVQSKPSKETRRYLNALYEFMKEIIDQFKGIINQCIGDGFMTTFGAPVELDNPCQSAVSAALQIQKVLQAKINSGEIPHTRIGIGIDGGEAIAGHFGLANHKLYTIAGNVVIVAARMEELTKQFDATILVSANVYKNINGNLAGIQSMGEVALKGLSDPIEIYRLA